MFLRAIGERTQVGYWRSSDTIKAVLPSNKSKEHLSVLHRMGVGGGTQWKARDDSASLVTRFPLFSPFPSAPCYTQQGCRVLVRVRRRSENSHTFQTALSFFMGGVSLSQLLHHVTWFSQCVAQWKDRKTNQKVHIPRLCHQQPISLSSIFLFI